MVLDAALALAQRGWQVFPCQPSKAPYIHGGLNEATTDADQIRDWWARWPDALIGVNCGRSGLAVIDIDDWAGFDQACDEHGDLPDTLTSETPSGGAHYIFDGDIKSTVSKVAAGVDTRGRGGYIIVPPSNGYRWVNRRQPAPLPEAWAVAADPPRPEPAPRLEATGEANSQWGKRVLEGEIARVATAVEGTRNHTLFQAACNLFEAVKGGHVDEQVARDQLDAVAQRAGLDIPEIEQCLDSAWERTQPRHPVAQLPAPAFDNDVADGTEDEDTFELLDVAQLRNMPPPTWVLEPLIPEGLTFLVGPAKVGKTFVALDWAATAAAAGARILYFVGEGSRGFAQRVTAWQGQHPHANLDTFHVVNRAPKLLDPTDVQRLHRTVARHPVDLLVIDTFSRAIRGANENDHGEMSNAIGTLDDLREQHGLSTLVVHHTNAGGEKPRGHTSLLGAYEALWQVSENDPLSKALDVVPVGMKDHGQPAPLYVQIRERHDGAVVYPSVMGDRGGYATPS